FSAPAIPVRLRAPGGARADSLLLQTTPVAAWRSVAADSRRLVAAPSRTAAGRILFPARFRRALAEQLAGGGRMAGAKHRAGAGAGAAGVADPWPACRCHRGAWRRA